MRLPQPAREFVKVVDAGCVFQMLFRSAEPVNRHGFREFLCDLFEGAARRSFCLVAGKWMDYSKRPLRGGAFDFRESGRAFGSEFMGLPVIELDGVAGPVRQRGQKFKGQAQIADQFAEFRTVAAIPGNYGIEAAEAIDDVLGGKQSQAIKS